MVFIPLHKVEKSPKVRAPGIEYRKCGGLNIRIVDSATSANPSSSTLVQRRKDAHSRELLNLELRRNSGWTNTV